MGNQIYADDQFNIRISRNADVLLFTFKNICLATNIRKTEVGRHRGMMANEPIICRLFIDKIKFYSRGNKMS